MYDHAESDHVVIVLDSDILKPITQVDNEDFAVEVALLSRNVVFEGATDDPNELHGAHLIVFHTPEVIQKLEGVEFVNFGQQGNLGRYPIHFHMCGDVSESVVSKNLIRESNQRCIVVHRSNNLLIDGNVAYDTSGHCFMTEDGAETGNTFSNNLGALTRRVTNLIPDNGTNGKETDDDASTFWMTNPTNSWVGNVAAGSESNGFWLELKYEVRGANPEKYSHIVPKEEPLTLFSNNVAHSNKDVSLSECFVSVPGVIIAFPHSQTFVSCDPHNSDSKDYACIQVASFLKNRLYSIIQDSFATGTVFLFTNAETLGLLGVFMAIVAFKSMSIALTTFILKI